jgi:hypothetical protein
MRALSVHCAALLWVLATSPQSFAEYVTNTAFCKSIQKNNCVGLFPEGFPVSLSDLNRNAGGPRVHFWVKMKNDESGAVGILWIRGGNCYGPQTILPQDKFSAHPSRLETFRNYITAHNISDLASALGIKLDASVGKPDAKINIATTAPSEGYRTHAYRNVLCAGSISARARSDGGTVSPSVLAVFRLMMSSTFVDCWTGRSAGLAPDTI